MTRPLLCRPAVVGGAVAVATAGLALLYEVRRSQGGLLNDFYSYWGAGRLLNAGQDPYDQHLLAAAQHAGGVSPTLGTGYSYPLFFAHLVRPLSLLPPHAAGAIFTSMSIVALGLSVALLLGSIERLQAGSACLLGMIVGVAPPVTGSVFFGQANLLVLLLLALAYRRVAPGINLGVAAAVKLFPAVGLGVLLVRPREERGQLVRGAAVFAALMLAPAVIPGGHGSYGSRFAELVKPDPYWTNVSMNGFVSRLAMRSSCCAPLLRGLPVGLVMASAVTVLGVATALVIHRVRGRPWEGCLALALAFGAVAAPKNSIWNYAPIVLCLVFAWPRTAELPRLRLALIAVIALVEIQPGGPISTLIPNRPPAIERWFGSELLFATLLLGGVVARLLLPAVRERWGARRADQAA